ncbi:MAG TPA: diguanylate cyclase [Phycisphaerae bacterium]|nr:diguanylate cyclase [Phycisphaerae bacterium]
MRHTALCVAAGSVRRVQGLGGPRLTIRAKLFCAFCSIPTLGLAVGLGLYFYREAVDPAWTAAALLTTYVLLGGYVIRAVTRPLTIVKDQTAAAARGGPGRRVHFRGHHELVELSVEINRVIGRAESATRQITDLQETIKDYEQQLERERSLREEQVAKRSRDLLAKSEIAAKDELTGLANRREALEQLRQLWTDNSLHSSNLACILVDIDHFKSFNDRYGHATGDLVLKEVAGVMRQNVRMFDTVCRVGGEEFLVLCRQGGAEGAVACAEHVRRAVEGHTFGTAQRPLHVTISLGVAERSAEMDTPADLLHVADERLYDAKRTGRNRVVASPAPLKNEPTDPAVARKEANRFRGGAADGEDRTRIRVLIADEETTSRHEWVAELTGRGLDVVPAANRGEVLCAARDGRFDVMVLSASLDAASDDSTGAGGLALIRALRAKKETRGIPVILVTRPDAPPAHDAIVEAGADDVMQRPGDAKLLDLRIRSWVRHRHELRELATRLEPQHPEQNLSVSKFFAYSRSLSQARTLEDVLDRTLAIVTDLTRARSACVLLPDRLMTHLSVARSVGLDAAAAGTVQIPLTSDSTTKAFQWRKVSIARCVEEAQSAGAGSVAALFSEWPLVFYPLSVQAQAHGVVCVGGRDGDHPLTQQELEYLGQIATMAASAVADLASRKASREARDAVVEALGTLAEYRDDNTGQHLVRVTQYSLLLAGTLRTFVEFQNQIDDQFLSDLIRAVPLHDIGKVGIPDRILLKNRRLTPEEMAIMRKHVDIGVETIQSVRNRVPGADYLAMAQDIAAGHHEWYDGTGYPKRLKAGKIPLSARIVALADVYDALTTERPYKSAYRHADAAQIIFQNSGKQFDPAVVEAFRKQEEQFASLAQTLGDPKQQPFADPMEAGAEGELARIDDERVEAYELAPME